ncbi:MAG: NAD(P)-binding protein, partial [Pseudomonadota bacterium]
AAWELSDPALPERYEITVYQMGWRLGGKCASGRDQGRGDRIEEHGLHVFFGYYDNAFAVLKAVYEALADQPGRIYPTVYDAMLPSGQITLAEEHKGAWSTWSIDLPDMPGLPGDGDPPGPFTALLHGLEALGDQIARLFHGQDAPQDDPLAAPQAPSLPEAPHWWSHLTGSAFSDVAHFFKNATSGSYALARALAHAVQARGAADPAHHGHMLSLLEALRREVEALWDKDGFDAWWAGLAADLRRAFVLVDLGLTVGIGALREGFFWNPTAAAARMNGTDFRAWLAANGAFKVTRDSAMVRALYDLTFAYPSGDHTQPGDLAAGSTVTGLFHMILYRGGFLWKMRAGTGDIVAAPMYEALKARGVRFEFFAKITEIEPSPYQDQIAAVHFSRQVRLKDGPYAPLIDVKGLPSWPSEPLYDQIVEGDALKARRINLESHWSGWEDTGGTETLLYGRDFDVAVCGIPIDALHGIGAKLIAAKPGWAEMVANVRTVQTQNVQLWLDRTGADLGPLPAGTVVGANDSSPLNAAGDVSEVLPAESWPTGRATNGPTGGATDGPAGGATGGATEGPKHLSIFSAAMPGPPTAPPPTAMDTPAKAAAAVHATALDFLARGAPVLWPQIATADGFDWSALYDPGAATGPERLRAQFLRANIDPDQRYTLSVAGSAQHRLRVDGSGYDNLYLCGDWTDNPGNLGGFESTIMSGRLAARAISGFPERLLRVPDDSPYYDQRPPYANPARLPVFVEYNGVQTFPGPFTFSDVKGWAFFLPGDPEKLAALTDQVFNIPSRNAVPFVPLSHMMMLSFIDIPKASSPYNPDASGAHEQEAALWVFLGRRESPDSDRIVSIGGFTPYLIINNPLGLIEGRNVWGYMKQLGQIGLPGPDDPGFSVDVYGVRKDPFTSPWDYRRLMTLTRQAEGGRGETFDDIAGAARLIGAGLADRTKGLKPSWQLAKNLWEDFLHRSMDQIFLKQFRDISVPERASFQAITSAPAILHSVSGISLTDRYRLDIDDLFNASLVETLGVPARAELDFGLSFTMEFTLGNGTTLWQAEVER